MSYLGHRWRYRTGRTARLRRLAVSLKCKRCGHNRWTYEGTFPRDPAYAAFVDLYSCNNCGWQDEL